MHQLLDAVAYCHGHGVLHRDLKPQNVLVDTQTQQLKLADFGLARAVHLPIDYRLTPKVVTLWYRAPELLLGTPTYSPAVDLWSLGVMMAEMVNGEPVWPHSHQIELLLSMFHDLGTPTVDTWPKALYLPHFNAFPAFRRPVNALKLICPSLDNIGADLLGKLLCLNPAHRISAKAAKRHPWFADIEVVKAQLSVVEPQAVPTAPRSTTTVINNTVDAKAGGHKADMCDERKCNVQPPQQPAVAVHEVGTTTRHNQENAKPRAQGKCVDKKVSKPSVQCVQRSNLSSGVLQPLASNGQQPGK